VHSVSTRQITLISLTNNSVAIVDFLLVQSAHTRKIVTLARENKLIRCDYVLVRILRLLNIHAKALEILEAKFECSN